MLAGFRDGPLALCLLQALLHAVQVRRQGIDDDLRVLGPIDRLGGEALLRQGDELRVGAAAVEPRGRIGQVAVGGLAADFLVRSAHIRRLARQDLAQDGAEGEHIGPAVEIGDIAAGLFGRHVRGGAQDRPGFCFGAETADRAVLRAVRMTVSCGS